MVALSTTTYCLPNAQVIHELIAGEVVIIHLGTGAYYSLDEAGAVVWSSAVVGADEAAIVAAVQARYQGDVPTISAAVQHLLDDLLAEQLLVVSSTSVAVVLAQTTPLAAPLRPFVTPQLQRYTDMQDLITLDPIHEVDDGGWPQRRPE